MSEVPQAAQSGERRILSASDAEWAVDLWIRSLDGNARDLAQMRRDDFVVGLLAGDLILDIRRR